MILLSAQGRRLDQSLAAELSALDRIVLICGRYEGVDERISEYLADREVSIGDYVLSGGELGAAVIVDTVTRLIPGAVGNRIRRARNRLPRKCSRARAPAPHLVPDRVRPAFPADCSTIRITRVPRIFAAWRCRKCW